MPPHWLRPRGYPVMIKATAGVAADGMRLVPGPDQLDSLSGQAPGRGGSKPLRNPGLYIEKSSDKAPPPRHIEIQVLATVTRPCDSPPAERDARFSPHQKLLEAPPARALDPDLRRRMGEAAIAAARSIISYEGAPRWNSCSTARQLLLHGKDGTPRIQVGIRSPKW